MPKSGSECCKNGLVLLEVWCRESGRDFPYSGDSTVRSQNVIVGTVFMILLGAALAPLTGCSESARDRANHRLCKELSQAEKLYGRALALLANPVYKSGDDYVPLERDTGQQADITVPLLLDVHPEVLPILERIDADLSAALSSEDSAEADDVTKALCDTMLSRCWSLRGFCLSYTADEAKKRFHASKRQASGRLTYLKQNEHLVGYYKLLATATDEDLVAMRAEAFEAAEELKAKMSDSDERLAAMDAEKLAQTKIYEQRSAEARRLDMSAVPRGVQQDAARLEKVLQLKSQASNAELVIAEIEHEVESLRAVRELYELSANAANSRIAAANEILAQRTQMVERNEAEGRQAVLALDTVQTQLLELVPDLGKACEDYAAAQAKTLEAYNLALKRLGRLDASGDDAVVRRADLLMRVADIQADGLAELQSNKDFAESFGEVWEKLGKGQVPAAIGTLRSFIKDPMAEKADAEGKYKKASELYQQVVKKADRNLRWAYQGQLASAYARLYALNRDPETLNAAREVLAEAIKNKEHSPNLTSLVQLQRILLHE